MTSKYKKAQTTQDPDESTETTTRCFLPQLILPNDTNQCGHHEKWWLLLFKLRTARQTPQMTLVTFVDGLFPCFHGYWQQRCKLWSWCWMLYGGLIRDVKASVAFRCWRLRNKQITEEVVRGLETKESPILFGLHPNFLRPDCREIMRVQKQIISHDMLTHSALLAARTHKPHKSEKESVFRRKCVRSHELPHFSVNVRAPVHPRDPCACVCSGICVWCMSAFLYCVSVCV